MFDGIPTYPKYRALRLQDPMLRGEDCYALQTLLDALGHDPKGLDGVFGNQTSSAVKALQKQLILTVDGIVGPRTWEAAVVELARQYRDAFNIATGLAYGQLAHESGFRGGIYSPARPDGSFDAGVAQLNSSIYPLTKAFHVPQSIELLCKNTRAYFDLFSGLEKRRRWALAAGAHNAPAFACWYARQEGATQVKTNQTAKPGAAAAEAFNAYVASVTAYMH